jgi:dephospho-CoA kinase
MASKVIGLTGGIGSGKSTTGRLLADLGAMVIDADKIGHEVLRQNTAIRQELLELFGRTILSEDGEIDRKKLGHLVFHNPAARAHLNRLLHPAMFKLARERIEESRNQDQAVIVLEAPLLLEAGWAPLVDEIWVTVASQDTVLLRLLERSQLSREESLARIHAQTSPEEKQKQAHVVIPNDGTLEDLKTRVYQLWQQRLAPRT